MYYIELKQDDSRVLINMDTVAFIEPNAAGSSVHIEKHTLYVNNSYEEIKDILFRRQGGGMNPMRLTK